MLRRGGCKASSLCGGLSRGDNSTSPLTMATTLRHCASNSGTISLSTSPTLSTSHSKSLSVTALVSVEPSKTLAGVYVVSMNHKPVNTLTPELLFGLKSALVTLQQLGGDSAPVEDEIGSSEKEKKEDTDTSTEMDTKNNNAAAPLKHKNEKGVTGVILTSGVKKVFSAGLDLSMLYAKLEKETFIKYWTLFQEVWILLNTFPMPVVAAINGKCPAAGCILALGCDARVMVDTSGGSQSTMQVGDKEGNQSLSPQDIGITAARAGFAAPPWVGVALAELVGSRQAEILMTQGTLVSSSQALQLGLVDTLVTVEENQDGGEVKEEEESSLLTAAHLEMEKWLAIPNPASFWITKEISRQSCLRFVTADDGARATDTSNFFFQLEDPKVKESLGKYYNSLKAKKHNNKKK